MGLLSLHSETELAHPVSTIPGNLHGFSMGYCPSKALRKELQGVHGFFQHVYQRERTGLSQCVNSGLLISLIREVTIHTMRKSESKDRERPMFYSIGSIIIIY